MVEIRFIYKPKIEKETLMQATLDLWRVDYLTRNLHNQSRWFLHFETALKFAIGRYNLKFMQNLRKTDGRTARDN